MLTSKANPPKKFWKITTYKQQITNKLQIAKRKKKPVRSRQRKYCNHGKIITGLSHFCSTCLSRTLYSPPGVLIVAAHRMLRLTRGGSTSLYSTTGLVFLLKLSIFNFFLISRNESFRLILKPSLSYDILIGQLSSEICSG